jgi:hypothetical protein
LWEADNYVCCNSSMVFQLFIEAHQFTGWHPNVAAFHMAVPSPNCS